MNKILTVPYPKNTKDLAFIINCDPNRIILKIGTMYEKRRCLWVYKISKSTKKNNKFIIQRSHAELPYAPTFDITPNGDWETVYTGTFDELKRSKWYDKIIFAYGDIIQNKSQFYTVKDCVSATNNTIKIKELALNTGEYNPPGTLSLNLCQTGGTLEFLVKYDKDTIQETLSLKELFDALKLMKALKTQNLTVH